MKEKLTNKLKDRYNILIVCFLIIAVAFISRLANLQLVNGEKYYELSQSKQLNKVEMDAARGNIMDRSGTLIATNRQGFNVRIVRSGVKADELNEGILKLLKIFDKNNDDYLKSFNKLIAINPLGFGSKYKKASNPLEKLKKELKNELGLKPAKVDPIQSLPELYNYLRKEVYKISNTYTDDEAYRIMTVRYEARTYSSINPVCIAKDISKKTVAEVEEKHNEFPGVTTTVVPVRKYTDAPSVAHILGYISSIRDTEYEKKKDQGYKMTDLIGQSGIELAAESYLRGKNGQSTIEVDSLGRQTGELEGEPAIPGSDVQLTIDMRLQKIASDTLARRIQEIRKDKGQPSNYGDAFAGAVVAIDVNNGEILAMASYPSYDPSDFIAGASDKEAQKRVANWLSPKDSKDILLRPMVNRAIAERYAPGSTFKPLVGIAALEEGTITPDTKINDAGTLDVDGHLLTCMEFRHGLGAHGPITLEKALATSCNIFFHDVGIRTGIDKIDIWGKHFGLGEKTGIDVDSSAESAGVLASRKYKADHETYKTWTKLDTAQVSIGQIYNAFTPIQLVNYTATIANGGKRYTPHLIKKVLKYDGSVISETKPQYVQIPVKKGTIDAVKKGMIAVTNSVDGTAVSIFDDLPFKVAGKTGTAETGEKNVSNNGVFICYAPANIDQKPQIAIAIVIQRGVFGNFAAPIAHDIMKEYFNLNNTQNFTDKAEPDSPVFTR